MENLYNKSHYKSGWKPIIREDESNAPGTYKKTDIPISSVSANEIKKPAEPQTDNDAVLKAISELGARINALDTRLTVQAESLENMKGLIAAAAEKNRKNILGGQKK